ncbi:unnamed protein product [Linum trigynum]|uniref:DUF4283 domain-containing protein n=1 Tax=Linum trigynum TaxID=586398 RepID=A0AAV2GJ46_9ROSI
MITTPTSSGRLAPTEKPPDLSGTRRPAVDSSSPNGKNAREATQEKKRVGGLNFEQEATEVKMDEGETDRHQDAMGGSGSSPWKARMKLFSDVVREEGWYAVESNTEDVTDREKEEEEYVVDEEDEDPRCSSPLFIVEQKIKWRREWRSALVVQGLGRRVPFLPLARRLNSLWAKHGDIQISDMLNICFFIRSRSKQDYDYALEGGPWTLGDSYLAVHRWYKGFNPWTVKVRNMLVWVQLLEIPVEFFNREAVMQIEPLIGDPIRVYMAIELGARMKYARVWVEVDLTRPLLGRYKIKGKEYLIRYEGLDNIRGECETYGKSADKCGCRMMEPEDGESGGTESRSSPLEEQANGRDLGDWMMVKKREKINNIKPNTPPLEVGMHAKGGGT